MILFYGSRSGDRIILEADDSAHCVRVLRHREGDEIPVIDGSGSLFHCVLEEASPKGACARIVSEEAGFGSHPYNLTLAVCPTKNIDRYEWMLEKVTEFGADVFVPVIGERSERRTVRTDRFRKLVLSATKQSLKGFPAEVLEPVTVMDFIESVPADTLNLIAYCADEEALRKDITDILAASSCRTVNVLIGPEGDFSPAEVASALRHGFVPVSLGNSRLRTETAALAAVAAVYFNFR